MKQTKTKIFYMGRQINGRFDSFKARVLRAVQWVKRVTIVTGILGAAFAGGALLYSTSTVEATTKTVQLPVSSPVLDRIADCESGNGTKGSATQYAKSGQVLMKPNTNGTVDVGKYQINNVWFAKATSLGFDLTTEKGNKAMAEWIYLNKGTGDWSASAKCWNK